MWKMLKLFSFILCAMFVHVDCSQEVLKNLSLNFGKSLELCKGELGLPGTVIRDFYNFWKEYVITSRHTGCALLCMSSKLDLLDPDYNLHHGKAQEFARKHGADEDLAKQLVNILHECGNGTPQNLDGCEGALYVANCFKTTIHKLNWAPNMDVIVGELVAGL